MLADAEPTVHFLGATSGPDLLQARIAAEHATVATLESTDFARIATRYAHFVHAARADPPPPPRPSDGCFPALPPRLRVGPLRPPAPVLETQRRPVLRAGTTAERAECSEV